MTALTPGELYEAVCDLWLDAHTPEGGAELLEFANGNWEDLAERAPSPEDAEVCRLAMLAAVVTRDIQAASVWRVRALARFSALGWVEGVGTLIIGTAFGELARANGDYSNGQTFDNVIPSYTALAILEEARRFTVGPGSDFQLGPQSPTQSVLRRLFHEKRGFLCTLSGDFDEARASYAEALLAAAGSERGVIKVELGLALLEYLQAGASADSELASQTMKLGERASRCGYQDLSVTANRSCEVMRRGGRHVLPYEIL